jgi:hypothetical protein
MDIGKAFTYVFEDERWITKVLIGGLFVLASIVLVGIPILAGYALRTMRNVMNGVEKPLPEWTNIGDLFKEGLYLAVIIIIWAIPVILIACIFGIAGGLAGSSNSSAGANAMGLLSTCVSCLAGLWSLAMYVFMPALFIRFAEKPEIRTGFEFAELWAFTRANISNIIIAVLLGLVASLAASVVGSIACGVGTFFTSFWAYTVMAHLYGQVGLKAKGGTGMDFSMPAPPAGAA